MLLMLNVTLVGCCSLSDSIYVSQIPQTYSKKKKNDNFLNSVKNTRSQESSHFSFAVLFPSVKLPEENKQKSEALWASESN